MNPALATWAAGPPWFGPIGRRLWRALGFEVLATIPDGFRHPVEGDVGLLIMYRRL